MKDRTIPPNIQEQKMYKKEFEKWIHDRIKTIY